MRKIVLLLMLTIFLGACASTSSPRRVEWQNPNDDQDQHWRDPQSYTLIFKGFTPDEMLDIEEYLKIFSGYRSYHLVDSMDRSSEYRYRSSISNAKLNRNLRKMIWKMDLNGRVTSAGTRYRVEKISRRKQRRQ